MIKRLLSVVLAVAMLASTNTIVFAAEADTGREISTVIEDSNNVRVVKETNEYGSTYIEFNKVTGDFTFTYPNGSKIVIDDTIQENVSSMAAVQAEEHTFSNYEYIKYRGGTWELRRPDTGFLTYFYFEIDSAAANDDKLDDLLENFKDKVETVNTAEFAFVGSALQATAKVALALGVGALPVPGTKVTATSILNAAGIEMGVAFTSGLILYEACEDAADIYFDIWDNYQDYVL